MATILIDTNVLVYAHDRGEHRKQEQANQISLVFTEDFPSAPIIEGVQFVDPFSPSFVLEEWV